VSAPGARSLLEALAITASIAFLLMILPHALEYAEEESFIVTPALEITNAWRAAAIPVGMGLMLLAGCFRLLRFGSLKPVLLALGLTVALVVLFWLAGPMLKPLGKLNLSSSSSASSRSTSSPACRSPSPSRSPPSAISLSPRLRH
jgi:hypothetical protein